MNRSRRLFNLIVIASASSLLGSALLFNSGCLAVAAGAGAGTVAYVRGELQANLDGNLSACTRATEKALNQLKFVKTEEKQDALTAVIIARTAEDKRIEVKLTSDTSSVVQVHIRVGVFGDSRISTAILEKIKANL